MSSGRKKKKRASRPRYKGITRKKKARVVSNVILAPAIIRNTDEPNLFKGTEHVKAWGALQRCMNRACSNLLWPGPICQCGEPTVTFEGPPPVV